MKLTDEMRAALESVVAESIVADRFPTATYEAAFVVGYRMGQQAMKERAEQAFIAVVAREEIPWKATIAIQDSIRALSTEE